MTGDWTYHGGPDGITKVSLEVKLSHPVDIEDAMTRLASVAVVEATACTRPPYCLGCGKPHAKSDKCGRNG